MNFEMKHNMEVSLYSWSDQVSKVLAENTKDLLEREKDSTPNLGKASSLDITDTQEC